ncbi:hypothetical protein FKW77_007323 [Venturia effusa]|uniref:Tubulin-specific chaperone A n=1 Tax=Venturia effusa TaxID=50376 RepID=A0A517L7L7_9PEZI|nr:hypothetical protein FKW77_007323 [Venturia effusa]
MVPPSQLTISTSSLQRLVKEEASYHKELAQQQARITELEKPSEDENAEYKLKQEKQALEETKAVLPSMKKKIQDALEKLEEQLEATGGDASETELSKAKEVIASAKEAIKDEA